MSTQLILQGANLDYSALEQIRQHLQLDQAIANSNTHRFSLPAPLSPDAIHTLRQQFEFDINQLPADFDPKEIRLLLTDMDSTLISIECIDEIADFLAIKPQVAEITESAMRGEIDFETSLNRRIALLKGLDAGALQHVYDERLQLNPGAEILLNGLNNCAIKTALVSGGFTFFTDRLKRRLNLDFTLANELAFDTNGKLLGLDNKVIVGAQRKADYLKELCTELNIQPHQVIAMGDGANDLLMMEQAGLSVAYHAKPAVQQQAMTALNYCGLDGVLGLLGVD